MLPLVSPSVNLLSLQMSSFQLVQISTLEICYKLTPSNELAAHQSL